MQMLAEQSDRRFMWFNAVVSTAALAFLAWLLLLRHGARSEAGAAPSFMPAVNASFNALSSILLLCGFFAIKAGKIALHKRLMVSAFASSSLFLLGYIAYHYTHGDTLYAGTGVMRTVYFTVLISHILLSTVIVPMALASFYFAWRERFVTHAKLARVLLPIWLYVSLTGVVIFFMLRQA